MAVPPRFVAAMPVPEAGLPATGSAAAPTGGLGQILSGENRQTIAGIFRRAGVGRGGQDGISIAADALGARPASTPASPAPSAAAASGACTLTVTTTGPADIVLRGAAAGMQEARFTCDQPLPATSVRIRTELKSGPADPKVLALPSQANGYALTLRLGRAGEWTVVVHWTR
jgi:hypothetical protein